MNHIDISPSTQATQSRASQRRLHQGTRLIQPNKPNHATPHRLHQPLHSIHPRDVMQAASTQTSRSHLSFIVALALLLGLCIPTKAGATPTIPISSIASVDALCHTSAMLATPRLYRAQRITIRLYKADIHHVLQLFSETFQFNLVISQKVQGRVSIFFRNVPWQQALYWILRSLQLHATIDHSVYQIAPLSARISAYQQ